MVEGTLDWVEDAGEDLLQQGFEEMRSLVERFVHEEGWITYLFGWYIDHCALSAQLPNFPSTAASRPIPNDPHLFRYRKILLGSYRPEIRADSKLTVGQILEGDDHKTVRLSGSGRKS
jgi:hypothetical protein